MTNKLFHLLMLTTLIFISGCLDIGLVKSTKPEVDTLYVHADGTMFLNDRLLPEEDVIIYEDGFGGEKAAVKMYPHIHPAFYRDSIVVERMDEETEKNIQN